MPRTLLSAVIVVVSLGAGSTASAHLLNMTRIEVDVRSTEMLVSIDIDLGQSLVSPQDYWRAAQATPSERAGYLTDALHTLNRDLAFLLDGNLLSKRLTGVEAHATSLESIRNPLTPQMARLHYAIPFTGGEVLQIRVAPDLDIPWPCLVTIAVEGARLPQSRLLTNVDRISHPAVLSADALASDRGMAKGSWWIDAWGRNAPRVAWVAVGFQHIVPKGLDHILFVLGLFFFNRGWRPLLIQVTGFTVAHSITLALSVYGVLQVPASVVEPLIALSIVYVALDNVYASRLLRWRLAIVVLFGLLHGLGFASVLAGIGLPEGQFLTSLLLFNLGVELGQLSVLLVAFLLVGWFRQQPWYAAKLAQPATVAIAGTGAYWFLKRIPFL